MCFVGIQPGSMCPLLTLSTYPFKHLCTALHCAELKMLFVKEEEPVKNNKEA